MQCQDYSTDSAAKGETQSHNIRIPMSLTQVQKIQGGFTQHLLRLVRKLQLPVRVRVHSVAGKKTFAGGIPSPASIGRT